MHAHLSRCRLSGRGCSGRRRHRAEDSHLAVLDAAPRAVAHERRRAYACLGKIHRTTCPCAAAPSVRNIITIEVHQPADRSSPGDPSSRMAMLAEITRSEEIALAQFNRLVKEHVDRDCLRPGARRNKRWARHTRRGLRMRDNRKATKWRAHKRSTAKLMNWVRAHASRPYSPLYPKSGAQRARRPAHPLVASSTH